VFRPNSPALRFWTLAIVWVAIVVVSVVRNHDPLFAVLYGLLGAVLCVREFRAQKRRRERDD
jgi:hypothetical protein